MRILLAARAAFALAFGHYPTGRVDFVDGDADNLAPDNLLDLPRRARSPGRRGGLKAERARDQAALDALDGGATTISKLASAMGSERSDARKRLLKLEARGLVEPPPRCCADRGWMLTHAGREQALTDLPPPPPLNGHRWLKPEAILAHLARDVAHRSRSVGFHEINAAHQLAPVGRRVSTPIPAGRRLSEARTE
jgi:HNH endonuclease